MILGNLNESWRYELLNPYFQELFNYVKENDMLNAPIGKIVLRENELFVNNNMIDGKKLEDQPLEAHQKYIDVHILLKGKETFGWKRTSDVKVWNEPYDEEKDCILANEKADTYFTLKPGDFVIVFPEDAHAPNISSGKIRKIVAKVLVV
jgi:biofilm protein TabA